MKYTIKRIGGSKICTVEIDCANGASESIKLGLAVRAALKNGANLSRAVLSGADLSGAILSCANLSGAKLSGANLYGADLYGADLSCANLSSAKLSGANLSDANLSGADLSDAYLSRADLSDSILSGAYLSRADLSDAKIGEYTIEKLVARATRSDGHEFFGFKTDKGALIRAGCRTMTVDEYRSHVTKKYPDTDKARETTEILKFIERMSKAMS
jgi:uncharacterized protein YjbI with pentapeptide repeats